MIQVGSTLKVIDNSGARVVKCIRSEAGRYAFFGDVILVSIKSLRKKRRSFSKVKKGEVVRALVVRTKKILNSKCSIEYLENSVVLINKKNKLIGTRVFGSLPKILRATKYLRILFLSRGIII